MPLMMKMTNSPTNTFGGTHMQKNGQRERMHHTGNKRSLFLTQTILHKQSRWSREADANHNAQPSSMRFTPPPCAAQLA